MTDSSSPPRRRLPSLGFYGQILVRTLPLLWRSAPLEMSFLTGALMLQGGIPAISLWLNKQVVDTIATALQTQTAIAPETLALLVISWTVALLTSALLDPWITISQGNLNERLGASFREQLMVKANSLLDLSRFENTEFYDELQLLQQRVEDEPLRVAFVLSRVGQQVFTLASLFFLLVPIGWWLPLLLIATSVPRAAVSFRLRRAAWRVAAAKSMQSRRMQYYGTVLLSDTYAKEVRLFGLGDFLLGRYRAAFGDMHQAMRRLRLQQAGWTSGLAGVSALGNAFGFYWVVSRAFEGAVSPGNVLLFIQSLSYVQQNLSSLVREAVVLYDALLYMERYFRFLDSAPLLTMPTPPQPVPQPIRRGITFAGVTFHYPDGRLALDNLSLTFYPGETVAIVGENGAGKTTLVKLLARFYDPTAGAITVDGEDLKTLDLPAWRQQMAMVFQDFGRYSLTLGENIALGQVDMIQESYPDPSALLTQAATQAGIGSVVARLGLTAALGKQFEGTELSGGEWQKLAIARAFIRQPQAQLLILDEPTASLDPRSEYEVYHRFAELAKGKTTVLITHRLASTRMADRIFVLKGGRLVEVGSHTALLAQGGEYANLWNLQASQYGAELLEL